MVKLHKLGFESYKGLAVKRIFLLIDIGNTRVKWTVFFDFGHQNIATLIPRSPCWEVFATSAKLPAVPDEAKAMVDAFGLDCLRSVSPEPGARVYVVVSCVNQPVWLVLLQSCVHFQGFEFCVVTAQPQCLNLRNLYDEPGQLGADRFCGLLAAAQNYHGQAVVLVSVGTACTVDALDGSGQFLGGYILPGPRLMADSLHAQTAQLPTVLNMSTGLLQLDWQAMPRNTQQAIASGVVAAQVGAVRIILECVQVQTGQMPLCLLSGGDSDWLKSLLPQAIGVDAIVLQGLLYWGWAHM